MEFGNDDLQEDETRETPLSESIDEEPTAPTTGFGERIGDDEAEAAEPADLSDAEMADDDELADEPVM